jgi:hypothetical protein
MTTTQIASATADTNTTHKGDTQMTTYKQPQVWDFLERENTTAQAAQRLYEWGLNCDRDGNPFLVYLDLIGWTAENGFTAFAPANSSYGYKELGYLADALTEYADSPLEVTAWIDELMSMEVV